MSVGWEKIGEDTYYFDKEGKDADRLTKGISVGLCMVKMESYNQKQAKNPEK
ncbi:MAG: hypothetical protein ACLTCI_02920 [[Clostridium] nexile]